GNDLAQWRAGVAIFQKVQVRGIYRGVDLAYYGNQQRLEYDFQLSPGANPQNIAMHFSGVDKVSISKAGELVLALGAQEMRQPKPDIYQIVKGERKIIRGGYRLIDKETVGF